MALGEPEKLNNMGLGSLHLSACSTSDPTSGDIYIGQDGMAKMNEEELRDVRPP